METVAKMINRGLVPRLPTRLELEAIADLEMSDRELDNRETLAFLEQAAVAVFDGFMPDGPGVTGRIAVVVWPAGIDAMNVYWYDPQEGWVHKI